MDALKEKLNGIEDGIPDFQCGLIGLDNKDLYNIETNPDWFKYDDKYLLYYNKDIENPNQIGKIIDENKTCKSEMAEPEGEQS